MMQSSCDNCSICLEALGENGVPLQCGHLYHGKCIVPWLQTKGNCPLCRNKPRRETDPVPEELFTRRATEIIRRHAEEARAAAPTMRLSGYKAYCHVNKRQVKDELKAESRSAAYLRAEARADEIGADPQVRRTMRLRAGQGYWPDGLYTPSALQIRNALSDRWTNLPDIVKTDWEEFASEATARGQVHAEGVRRLLENEPQFVPGLDIADGGVWAARRAIGRTGGAPEAARVSGHAADYGHMGRVGVYN